MHAENQTILKKNHEHKFNLISATIKIKNINNVGNYERKNINGQLIIPINNHNGDIAQ